MPFLVVASQTIPVAVGTSSRARTEIGKVERAFDGTARSSVRARKNDWPITTTWGAAATIDTIRAALEGTPPLAASGDLTGSVNVVITGIREDLDDTGSYKRLSFTMMEA